MAVRVGGVGRGDVGRGVRGDADGLDPQPVRIDDLEQRVARRDDLAGAHVGDRDDAGDRRLERHALGVLRRQHALLLAQRLELGARIVDVLLRDDAGDARQARELLLGDACSLPSTSAVSCCMVPRSAMGMLGDR